jgi:HEAT repeat protein
MHYTLFVLCYPNSIDPVMAKSSKQFETKLARIAQIKRTHPSTAEAELRVFLRDPNPASLMALAVEAAAELRLHKLAPDLIALFQRMRAEGKDDPGYTLARKIVEALTAFETPAKDLYLLAFRTREAAPWDRAAGLRIAAAHALSQVHYQEAVQLLVEGMIDPVPEVQAAVLRALGSIVSEATTVLLTYKLLAGDPNLDVLGACMDSLVRRDVERTIPLVSRYLRSDEDGVVQAAALALGESREPSALEPLMQAFRPHSAPRVRQTVLVAIALLREGAGVEFLLNVLKREKEAIACEAIVALAAVRHMPTIEARVRTIVAARSAVRLTEALATRFDQG